MMALVGIFTVAGPLHYFLIAMVFHQDWLAKCQEEVDKVCEGRMPTLFDSPNLPVLRACILETMRWKPNVPTGVTHGVKADDSTAVSSSRKALEFSRSIGPSCGTPTSTPTLITTIQNGIFSLVGQHFENRRLCTLQLRDFLHSDMDSDSAWVKP